MGVGTLPDVVTGYNWELYNMDKDYSQAEDLAAKMPDKLRQMQELFLLEGVQIPRVSPRQQRDGAGCHAATEPAGRQDRLHVLGGSLGHTCW